MLNRLRFSLYPFSGAYCILKVSSLFILFSFCLFNRAFRWLCYSSLFLLPKVYLYYTLQTHCTTAVIKQNNSMMNQTTSSLSSLLARSSGQKWMDFLGKFWKGLLPFWCKLHALMSRKNVHLYRQKAYEHLTVMCKVFIWVIASLTSIQTSALLALLLYRL